LQDKGRQRITDHPFRLSWGCRKGGHWVPPGCFWQILTASSIAVKLTAKLPLCSVTSSPCLLTMKRKRSL